MLFKNNNLISDLNIFISGYICLFLRTVIKLYTCIYVQQINAWEFLGSQDVCVIPSEARLLSRMVSEQLQLQGSCL